VKRIRFVTRRTGVDADAFARGWRDEVARAAEGTPVELRPARVTLGVAMPSVIPDQRYDGVLIEWFADPDHLARFEAWSGAARLRAPSAVSAPGPSVVVDEVVLRGQDWLDRRWREGAQKLKHMALAHRAAGLSPSEFSDAWKRRAGTLRGPGDAAPVRIPDDVRGLAYVQNHPHQAPVEPAYDAVNEVYFEDLDGLRRRVDWFAQSLGGGTEDDLVAEHCFLAVAEAVLVPGPSDTGA